MKAALLGSFAVSTITSLFLWSYFPARGVLQASELMNWMGVFVTSLSLTFAVYIVVLAVDAYSHLNELRAARSDLRSIRDEQSLVQAALRCSTGEIQAIRNEINRLRKRHIEFVLRLNTQVVESLYLLVGDGSTQLKTDFIRTLEQESALLIVDSFFDDPDVVMPQIYTLLEVGDEAALARAKNWLVEANVPETELLLQKITGRIAALAAKR